MELKAFNKIIGYESVKEELYQIVDVFRNIDMYEKMGAKLPKGILIYGAPGMGKSLLSNALIEECGVKTFVLKKTKDDLFSMVDISDCFEKAATEEKAIIFIDDIDKFSEEDDTTDDMAFAAIQSGIDSVKDKRVLVIATANNIRKLPDSLRRSGRFDRKIELLPPTGEDAKKIMEYYFGNKPVVKDLNYDDVSKMINYTSCAELEKIINESAIYAVYKRKDSIDMDDIIQAYLRSQFAIINDGTPKDPEEIRLISLHEAGHVVIAEALHEGIVGIATVKKAGRDLAGGFTKLCKDIKRRPESVLYSLGGKVAVELFYGGKCASGCQSDISKAVDYVREGITSNATLGISMVDVSDSSIKCSDSYLDRVSSSVHAELERYMFIARDIILANKDFLMGLAEKLEDKGTILSSDIKAVRDQVTVTSFTV